LTSILIAVVRRGFPFLGQCVDDRVERLPIDQSIEALLRQLVRLTILPLSQIATLPGVMMRSPKRLALMFSILDVRSSFCYLHLQI
jgi:hypothetical protein